ncbi:DUF202 domain-containing protein [Rhodococcus wratislaviensis]|uniref:DUF202 domain-containing protein n=1 Tax=Rhodococcus wratislaviensis TaxID=44752 RepID=UPI00364EFE98
MTGVQVRDAGLQPERTALAWRRTSLSAIAAALFFAHFAAVSGAGVAGVAGVPVAGMALALLGIGLVAGRRVSSLRRSRAGMTGRSALLISLLLAATAASAVAVAVLGR